MMNLWEPPPVTYTSIDQAYDWAIVLAGITEPNRPPYDRVQFNKGADRIVHAIQLYHLGKVKKILISGGSGTLTFEGVKESHALADFARMCGVDSSAIYIEDQSRNTHENASFSATLLPPNETSILFTSAFHMRRAKACFEKTGLYPDAFPTDYYGGQIRATPDALLIPSVYSLQLWSILIKEWMGLTAYRLAGYI
ncbi:YdcF family protein [Reichenbachiella sp. 5M10]|uniref:YdcF family protein n=1 Tax=Reichenbachiella sp. 5M10 TaxID=1889772 RepID=UPI001304050D|nr:YdcF family protein [Reichenbachiella sp. 5M10]